MPRRRLQGLLMGATSAGLIASCGGGNGGGGGGAGTPPPAAPPAITQSTALATATNYFAVDNAAQQTLDMAKMATVAEGPLAQYDTIEYTTYKGHRKAFPPYTATCVKVVVPAHGGEYPADFLCEATLQVTGSPSQNAIVVFQQDSPGSTWRANAVLTFGGGAFPSFSLDSSGYGDELTAPEETDLSATGVDIAYGWANYIAKPLFGMNAVNASVAVNLAAGPNTTQYLSHLQSLFTGATRSGGSNSGYVNPQRSAWAYQTVGGGAFVIFIEDTEYEVDEGNGSLTLTTPVDTLLPAGTYTGLKEDAINILGAIDPPRSSGGAITLPDATTDYTAATGA